MNDDLLDEIADSLDMLEEPTSPMAMIARMVGMDPVEAWAGEPARFELYDRGGAAMLCHICEGNRWAADGVDFVCEHSRDEEYIDVPMRVAAEVKRGEVGRYVQIKG